MPQRDVVVNSLSAGVKVAHDDAEHLAGQPGVALGHVNTAAELAGFIGQVAVGACNSG